MVLELQFLTHPHMIADLQVLELAPAHAHPSPQFLRRKWYVSLPVGTEDYPGGAAAFYHSCHFGEPTEYCPLR